MSWKKIFVGEKMPDKNDPKYHDRYEKEVEAGREFARMTRIDKVAGKLQHFAIGHQKAFLTIVFGFIVFSFSLNIYRMRQVWSFHQTAISAIEQQDEMLRNRHKRIKEAISSNHVNAENHGKNQKTNKENDGHTEED